MRKPDRGVPGIGRRVALGLFGAIALAGAGGRALGYVAAPGPPARRPALTWSNALVAENAQPGSDAWRVGADGTVGVNDIARQIQGYASATSVSPGEDIAFHVSVATAPGFTVDVYRVGHYGGAGARKMTSSPVLPGTPQPVPRPDRDGLIACRWPVSWTLTVPADWRSGIYLAVFTTTAGNRGFTTFVVRELDRDADILAIVPVTTYQAYNVWPMDKTTGKSLYRGYTPTGVLTGLEQRAHRVSFDRPYARSGLPILFGLDTAFARWAEGEGHDITYATGIDLDEGRVDPQRYSAIVFPGHDEYWTTTMRERAEAAHRQGTHQAYLAANSIYWHIRLDPSTVDGRPRRVVTCYKERDVPDPNPGRGGPTVRWRSLGDGHRHAEQGFLGVQYNGIPTKAVPLIVRESRHWFWQGTGVKDGDAVPGLVDGEADGFNPEMPSPKKAERTLLSASPYTDSLGRGRLVQNTSLLTGRDQTVIFVAGTYNWSTALGQSGRTGDVVRTATRNLFGRMLTPRE
ncbi:hypothetical protein Afil01_50690 [Actinorhabdospora filicis]|uniref:N,N-dimethylformamidase beta subunit-like C-terminal domain-containing protein n=1 Tax=Actinorhabdospora filicis TaxID=1785913 RepID=A0A9W6SQF1_9ACTN|nr:N,N-dimethylformamidase beta subunit family domain-containing protein [Actinorhabdospora filicis]GLZ80262.1 hypothetical protein Afil01_50690 [Actinorhabdospora filicis]